MPTGIDHPKHLIYSEAMRMERLMEKFEEAGRGKSLNYTHAIDIDRLKMIFLSAVIAIYLAIAAATIRYLAISGESNGLFLAITGNVLWGFILLVSYSAISEKTAGSRAGERTEQGQPS